MPSFSTSVLAIRLFVQALINPVCVGALALVEQDGKIVLIRQSYTRGWHLPGGGVKPGEPPEAAALRELREEIGLTASAPPELFGVYSRRLGLVTNLVFLYRLREAAFDFRPTWEIRALTLAEPTAPPSGTTAAVRRRLKEYVGASRASTW